LLISLKKVEGGIMEREAGIRKGDWKGERVRVETERDGEGKGGCHIASAQRPSFLCPA